MKILIIGFILLITTTASFAAYVISCPSKAINALNQTDSYTTSVVNNGITTNQTIAYDVPYFDSMFNANDCTINQVSDNSVYNVAVPSPTPAEMFNINEFLVQLSSTNLLTSLNIFQYYAVLKDMLSFQNFQGAANLIAGLLQGGIVTQNEVDVIDNTLEQQQINLDSYNSEVNVSY